MSLSPRGYPDAVNKFRDLPPGALVRPGQVYANNINYRFGINQKGKENSMTTDNQK